MKIFEQEIKDGLEHSLSSTASFVYACEASPYENKLSKIKTVKSLASYSDDDLYYVQSILVSSNWNKNDDIFDRVEVWSARATPEDKPTNLDHDENTIIGHIVANWPITEDGLMIDDNTPVENLPEKYHILTASVIYRSFSSPELRERAEKLIAEIQNGTKYVSMECFFKGFDYGLIDRDTNQYTILERNESTAHLTKYLRAYGGMGEHEQYKIGRVLRNITFSGKGFVDKPANPESIIFNTPVISQNKIDKKNEISDETGVSYNKSNLNVENNTMSLEKEIAEIKEHIVAMADCSKNLSDANTVASTLESQNLELKSALEAAQKELTEVKAAFDAAVLEKEEAAEDMKKKKEEMEKMKAEILSVNEVLAGYKEKEEEMMKKEKKMSRKASLLDKGIDSETAEATVDKLEGLSDEMFDTITSLWAAKMPPWMDKEKDKEKKEDKKSKSSDTVDETVLETASETEEVDLGVGETEVDSENSTRAALIEFVYNRLGKQLNKGE
jgi:hypothetical protein